MSQTVEQDNEERLSCYSEVFDVQLENSEPSEVVGNVSLKG